MNWEYASGSEIVPYGYRHTRGMIYRSFNNPISGSRKVHVMDRPPSFLRKSIGMDITSFTKLLITFMKRTVAKAGSV